MVKRIYQLSSFALDRDHLKVEGKLCRVTPVNEYEYFYGYYDKSPWDASDRYIIATKVLNATESPAPKKSGSVVLIDTHFNNREIVIGETNCWNTQQGCMAQWLGPDFTNRLIYNDFRCGKYVSVIFNVDLMYEEDVLPLPIYDVSKDGKFAMSLDFSRLHRMRPGYGYSNITDSSFGQLVPDSTAVWKIDLETKEVMSILSYSDFVNFENRDVMNGAEHKLNHIMINPEGTRMMILHRWYLHGEKFTRLVTVDTDGENMFNLNDNNFTSHSYWKNNEEILSFAQTEKKGKGYFIFHDKQNKFKKIWPELETDGHMSYSPDGNRVVTDTYPNRKRVASVFVNTETQVSCIAKVFSPFKYDNDVRCDLHPRWNRSGTKICIDSVHDGKRAIYIIDVS